MDHISIPSFALLRYGTVIVRLKMEKYLEHFSESCHRDEGQLKGVSRLVHRVFSCEHCTRTRLVSQCSDCDSALVGKCRPYRTRAAKSRYVNVCAAVCLLLVVGGLTPQSSAAPHRTRAMDRSRRANDQESDTWSNPCDYDNVSNMSTLEYKPDLAVKVSQQAKSALASAKMYKDDIANLHNYNSFEAMLDTWRGTEWLRNYSWFKDGVLPRSKELGQEANKEDLHGLMTTDQLTQLLPVFTKSMKMLAAGLRAVSGALYSHDTKERMLKSQLNQTSENLRSVLCLTSDLLQAGYLQMMPLMNSEIPTYSDHDETTRDVFLIYRDTINFLEYVDEFFDVLSKTVPKL